jgi:DNA-binding NtrC family response regulator
MRDAVVPGGDVLIGDSPPMRAVLATVTRLAALGRNARRSPAVLIQGETGTGKGLVASLLHRASRRSGGPFVDLNCAAIPASLVEAELFGFVQGAFTDARHAKRGLFQVAHGGTIFLDEIGLLPEALQAKLLKVVEDGTVRPLGSTEKEASDAWIITATNEDLAAAARAGRFRDDLYHRLAVLTVHLPPLRERGGDIPRLAAHFLARAGAMYRVPAPTLTPCAVAKLEAYTWPGNVRELANLMERLAVLTDAAVIDAAMLARALPPVRGAAEAGRPVPGRTLEQVMRAHIATVLAESGGNIRRTAVNLGIARNTLRAHLDKLGLRPSTRAFTAS